jgi:hypothetical protein
MRTNLDSINILFTNISEKLRKYTIDINKINSKIKNICLEKQFLDLFNNADKYKKDKFISVSKNMRIKLSNIFDVLYE